MSSPLDRFRLDGRTVAITGASSGFGHHFAGVLAAAGARVVLGARRVEKIEERVEEIRTAGGEALGLALDVCDSSSLAGFLDSAWGAYGGVDVLIQNAGVEAGAKTYMTIDEEDWNRVLDTNLKSVWLGAKLYTERVTAGDQTGGNFVNIGSITSTDTSRGSFRMRCRRQVSRSRDSRPRRRALRHPREHPRAGLHPDRRQSRPARGARLGGIREGNSAATLRRIRRPGWAPLVIGLRCLELHDGLDNRRGRRASLRGVVAPDCIESRGGRRAVAEAGRDKLRL